jgi:2-(3-amino-3-carboxypropyl)histidine synthase
VEIVEALRARLPAGSEAIVLGDTTYGACCVDDTLARALGAGLLVHFGHAGVVPRAVTDAQDGSFAVLYVRAVARAWSEAAAADAIAQALAGTGGAATPSRVALVSTAQFSRGLPRLCELLRGRGVDAFLPQIGELGPGEILGCTAPAMPPDVRAILFVGDGRFHVEAAAMANPTARTMRYDPYTQKVTDQPLDAAELARIRADAVAKARAAKIVGIAFSTLGRQASRMTLARIEAALDTAQVEHVAFCMDDVSPAAVAQYPEIDAWVQLACPRLSIDWSSGFSVPILTAHEAIEAFSHRGAAATAEITRIPMDNWAFGSSHYRH